jgi:protein-tyrosine phosphatase
MENKCRILFVCLGNICRSPLAEGVFLNLINQKDLQDFYTANSAGTIGYHIGALPDKRSRDVAMEHGFELRHYASKISQEDFTRYEYIVAMDHSNVEDIKRLAGNNEDWKNKILLMRDFDLEARGMAVPDPYYDGPEKFEEVYHMLVKANEGFIEWLEGIK